MMHTDFELPQPTIESVFRRMFSESIAACGLADLPPSSLRAQYNERNYASRVHIWTTILRPSHTPQETEVRREIRDRIADTILQVDGNANREQLSVSAEHLLIVETILTLLVQHSSRAPSQSQKSPVTPKPKKRGRPRKLDHVLIPSPARAEATKQRSPPTRSPKTPKPNLYRRRYGPTLHISDKALAKIPSSYIPPTVAEAHPKLPAVLFRFHSEDQTHCINSENGFVASKFIYANVVNSAAPPVGQVVRSLLPVLILDNG